MRSVVSNIRSYAPLLEESLSIGFYFFIFFFIWPTISIKMYLYSIDFFLCGNFWLNLFKMKTNYFRFDFIQTETKWFDWWFCDLSLHILEECDETFLKHGISNEIWIFSEIWCSFVMEALVKYWFWIRFGFIKTYPGQNIYWLPPSYFNPYFSSRMVFITFVRSFPFEFLHEHNSQRWKK